jgi:hypothetical protein
VSSGNRAKSNRIMSGFRQSLRVLSAPPSRQTLRSRLRYHFRGNAEGSTLRLSLGCLLSQSLGIELRRVGSGRRMTFGVGERVLSDWLERNARVACLACDEPWRIEKHMIRPVSLPLNLDQNRHHGFHSELAEIRRAAKARARELPVTVRRCEGLDSQAESG